ncbi:hypothetical protein IU438_04160 [Nocardia cyriacigeorgica]|jgi:hypothetical protein|uniref:hypothetical protein n=1 Tax=Nocardia cyriacigeorgica TaxID=135487 RepID=UPI000CEA5595|nr:hypothetical protein [Nocardia cyriacigeorgica]AVH22166.1 hypothetical protein C5B73_12635 [Nocardia cyriacigeorgica]MBF6086298.1 hypothetical protein [Nocardia cyriacigeorgica]MBF6091386.1 hypothetical protein [Nocardia cyriacigeorgica]MBF6321739.1 hypothetical protein [Nocardia cyriacigeorgica]MBF6394977.1 hypothetical protein [Nocardia cyriacigeorgica]
MSLRRGCATLLAVAVTILPVAACGDSDDGAAQEVTNPVSTTAPSTPTENPSAATGEPFTADPTIVGPHPIPFTSWTALPGNRIAISFETGAPECYGVDATVTETDEAVSIELRSGTRADAVGKMCVMIAVFGTLELQLQAPVGDREVRSAA